MELKLLLQKYVYRILLHLILYGLILLGLLHIELQFLRKERLEILQKLLGLLLLLRLLSLLLVLAYLLHFTFLGHKLRLLLLLLYEFFDQITFIIGAFTLEIVVIFSILCGRFLL